MKSNFSLSGFEESKRVLDTLPVRVEKRILQGAASAGAREGAKFVRKAAPRHEPGKQSSASIEYGQLHKNIRVGRLRRQPRRQKGARIHTNKSFWGLILELGSRYISATPWFKPAVADAKSAMLDKAASYLRGKIPVEAAKLRRENNIRGVK